jgi:hypothetical protein
MAWHVINSCLKRARNLLFGDVPSQVKAYVWLRGYRLSLVLVDTILYCYRVPHHSFWQRRSLVTVWLCTPYKDAIDSYTFLFLPKLWRRFLPPQLRRRHSTGCGVLWLATKRALSLADLTISTGSLSKTNMCVSLMSSKIFRYSVQGAGIEDTRGQKSIAPSLAMHGLVFFWKCASAHQKILYSTKHATV